MEWQERQSLWTVCQTPLQAAVPMPILEAIPPLGEVQGGEEGILLLQVEDPEKSGASWTWEGTLEQSTRGNRMGILIAANRMLTVIHGLSFAIFTAGGSQSSAPHQRQRASSGNPRRVQLKMNMQQNI